MRKNTLTTSIRDNIYHDLIENQTAGTQIMAEKDLSEKYGVSITTIRRSIDLLVQSHHLIRRHGSGTYILRANGVLKIGLLIPESLSSVFYTRLGQQVAIELRDKGYDSVIFYTTDNSSDFDKEYNSYKDCDFLIICGYYSKRDQLMETGIPCCIAGTETIGELPCISFNLFLAIKQIVKRLHFSGCRNIRFVFDNINYGSIRALGFFSAFYELHIEPEKKWLYRAGNSFNTWKKCLDDILENDTCDAIIIKNDRIAQAFTQLLINYGIDIPKDISIVSCDNFSDISEQQIPITTLKFNFQAVAKLTVSYLDNFFGKDNTFPKDVSLSSSVEIVKMKTTKESF